MTSHQQQLAAMREEVLYVIFLDLTKAYDALVRSRTREILKGDGVGDRVRRLLATYWERLYQILHSFYKIFWVMRQGRRI